jgi:hypothetical protein
MLDGEAYWVDGRNSDYVLSVLKYPACRGDQPERYGESDFFRTLKNILKTQKTYLSFSASLKIQSKEHWIWNAEW